MREIALKCLILLININLNKPQMNTFKQSAIEILKKKDMPLHYIEITRLALESGILETESTNPEKTMNAQLTVDIKSKKEGSDFIKISTGIFALNPQKKEI
jgi:hypothetical protein